MEESTRCSDLGIARYLITPVKQSDLRDALPRGSALRRPPYGPPAYSGAAPTPPP